MDVDSQSLEKSIISPFNTPLINHKWTSPLIWTPPTHTAFNGLINQ